MFCFRHSFLGNGAFESYGTLDKRKLEAARIRPVLSDQHGTRAAQQLGRVRQRIDAECEVANDADQQFTAVELSGASQPD